LGTFLLKKLSGAIFFSQTCKSEQKTREISWQKLPKIVFPNHNIWRLHGLNKWLGTFISKKLNGPFFRNFKLEQKTHEISLQKLPKIVFLKTQLLTSSWPKQINGKIYFEKTKRSHFFGRTCKSEQKTHEISLQMLSKIVFLKTQLLASLWPK
jgi:hypothetical protein